MQGVDETAQCGPPARRGRAFRGSRSEARNCNRGEPGFTLIEIILVILLVGILAGLAANLLTNTLDQARFDESRRKMTVLSNAMVGNPELNTNGVRSDFGFVADIGRLPTSLTELVAPGALPAWNAATGVGWHGPYVPGDFAENPDGYRTDGWGTLFTYANATGIVTSLGSDGAAGGTGYAADFSVPDLTAPTDQRVGTITGRITDMLGNPLASVAGATVAVSVANNPVNGLPQAPAPSVNTAADGSFILNNILIGRRIVQVTVTTGAATTYPSKVVTVTPTQPAQVNFQVPLDTTIPCQPTGVSPLRPPGFFSQLNITWTAPTLNAPGFARATCPPNGSSLGDLAGYNIYRNTTGVFASPPAATDLIASIGPLTTYTDGGVGNGRQYYYTILALDKANNLSANSPVASAWVANGAGNIRQVSPVTITTTTVAGDTMNFAMTNTTGAAITVTQVTFSWTGGPAQWNRMQSRIPTSAAWVTNYNAAVNNGVARALTTNFALTASGTANDTGLFNIRFTGAITVGRAVNIQLNVAGAAGTFVVE
jgi:prepilin-type N-terminal cleavage/methylation domain-containing protein